MFHYLQFVISYILLTIKIASYVNDKYKIMIIDNCLVDHNWVYVTHSVDADYLSGTHDFYFEI